MKRTILILALMIISVIVYAQTGNLARLDEKRGIKNIKLGMLKKDFNNKLEKTSSFNPDYHDWYELKGDKLMIGDVKVHRILYGFVGDKLYSIQVSFDSGNSATFVSAFTQLYGKPVIKGELFNSYNERTKNLNGNYKQWNADHVMLSVHKDYFQFYLEGAMAAYQKRNEIQSKKSRDKLLNDL